MSPTDYRNMDRLCGNPRLLRWRNRASLERDWDLLWPRFGKDIIFVSVCHHSFCSHCVVFNYDSLPLRSENASSSGEWNSQTKSKGKQTNYLDIGDYNGSFLSRVGSFLCLLLSRKRWEWSLFLEILPVFYTVINFVVFVIFNETFREGCRQLLCRPWICIKCNACSLASVTPQEHNETAPNSSQQNHALENLELEGK